MLPVSASLDSAKVSSGMPSRYVVTQSHTGTFASTPFEGQVAAWTNAEVSADQRADSLTLQRLLGKESSASRGITLPSSAPKLKRNFRQVVGPLTALEEDSELDLIKTVFKANSPLGGPLSAAPTSSATASPYLLDLENSSLLIASPEEDEGPLDSSIAHLRNRYSVFNGAPRPRKRLCDGSPSRMGWDWKLFDGNWALSPSSGAKEKALKDLFGDCWDISSPHLSEHAIMSPFFLEEEPLPSPSDPSLLSRHSPVRALYIKSPVIDRTPSSRQALQRIMNNLNCDSYQSEVENAQQRAAEMGFAPPSKTFIEQLYHFGATWDEVCWMLINQLPHKEVLNRLTAKKQNSELAPKDKAPDHSCLGHLRKVHLLKPKTSPIKAAAWSPGLGPLTNFVTFMRQKLKIGEGRNIALAIARDPATRHLIYTFATTDGPPGGTHSELLAWDAMPSAVKDRRRVLIYTERQPCEAQSNCNAKLKEALGEGCYIVYAMPIIRNRRAQRTVFMDRTLLQGLIGKENTLPLTHVVTDYPAIEHPLASKKVDDQEATSRKVHTDLHTLPPSLL